MSNVLFYETKMPTFNLGALSLKDLDQHLHRLVKTERKIMDEVLRVISEMDSRRGYLQLGFGSLFSYLVKLGYSESAAQRRITAARLMQKMNSANRQKVEQSLKEGSINLTQLSKVNSLFDYLEKLECQGELIEINTAIPKLIENLHGQNAQKTDAVIEKTLNSILPAEKQKELNLNKKPKIKKQVTGRVKITLDLTSELDKKLQKVLDAKSHSNPDRDVLILFEKLLDDEIKKIDGPSKVKIKSSLENQSFTAATNSSPVVPAKINSSKNNPTKTKRKPISILIKRRVYKKAGYQCEYISPLTGERCPETRFLNIDHAHPLALGGSNEESNCQIFCKSHNLAEAQRMGLKIPKVDSKNI